jgi:hypothetical protein
LNDFFALAPNGQSSQGDFMGFGRHILWAGTFLNCNIYVTCHMQSILEKASKRFPQFEEHARFLSVKNGGVFRFGGIVSNVLKRDKKLSSPVKGITEESRLSREDFAKVLKTIDLGLRTMPATAQVSSPSKRTSTGAFLSSDLKGR